MRQVSPESPDIFDFIMELHRACSGDWNTLVTECNILPEELEAFLEYAGMFLCNLGNFYAIKKFVPDLTVEALHKIAAISPTAKDGLEKIIGPLLAVPPFSLDYPSKNAQSAYYPGTEPISQQEIAKMSEVMEQYSIGPENTRVRKLFEHGKPVYQLLQASAETGVPNSTSQELADDIFAVKGDHAEELAKVCLALERAKEYAGNNKQTQLLSHYIECFRTGSLEAFQGAQKAWVTDVAARVEHLMGFIEPYRDPAGIRLEWETMVGIADPDEAARLKRLVESSTAIIRQLPWAAEDVNDGKGPFETSLFEAPDFTSVHVTQYEYIRETCGFKNVVLVNRLTANNNPQLPCYWVAPSELKFFKDTTHIVRFITPAIHELLGHGTGKLPSETAPGIYNFDEQNLPISPISEKAVTSHYLPSQT
ncbi:hypothetical protein QQX98_009044 [Neonectria punicea]|uniref:Dipeptidyl peptidase 3 n=1 Tax=Neonectria punicea TaxID=979145 RepID=A0ABR1GTL3_9HYPO